MNMNSLVLPTAAELEADIADTRPEQFSAYISVFTEAAYENSELCGC
jgi:hypothetical protein